MIRLFGLIFIVIFAMSIVGNFNETIGLRIINAKESSDSGHVISIDINHFAYDTQVIVTAQSTSLLTCNGIRGPEVPQTNLCSRLEGGDHTYITVVNAHATRELSLVVMRKRANK